MADVRDAGMGIDIQVTWGPGEEERMRPQSSVTGLRSSKWMSNTAATQSACRQSLGPARWGAPDSLLKAPIRLTHATWNTAAREQELMTSRCERVPGSACCSLSRCGSPARSGQPAATARRPSELRRTSTMPRTVEPCRACCQREGGVHGGGKAHADAEPDLLRRRAVSAALQAESSARRAPAQSRSAARLRPWVRATGRPACVLA
jgi:hypothetical protein